MALSDEPPDDEDLQALEGGDPEAEFGAIRAELDAMDADLREETVVVGRLHVDPMLVEHRKGDLLLWSIDPVIKNGKKDKYAGGFQNADIRIDTSTYGKGRVRVKRWGTQGDFTVGPARDNFDASHGCTVVGDARDGGSWSEYVLVGAGPIDAQG